MRKVVSRPWQGHQRPSDPMAAAQRGRDLEPLLRGLTPGAGQEAVVSVSCADAPPWGVTYRVALPDPLPEGEHARRALLENIYLQAADTYARHHRLEQRAEVTPLIVSASLNGGESAALCVLIDPSAPRDEQRHESPERTSDDR